MIHWHHMDRAHVTINTYIIPVQTLSPHSVSLSIEYMGEGHALYKTYFMVISPHHQPTSNSHLHSCSVPIPTPKSSTQNWSETSLWFLYNKQPNLTDAPLLGCPCRVTRREITKRSSWLSSEPFEEIESPWHTLITCPKCCTTNPIFFLFQWLDFAVVLM